MSIEEQLRDLEEFYYREESDTMSAVESANILYDKQEVFTNSMEKYIRNMPIGELRELLESDDWIVEEPDINDIPDSSLRQVAIDALSEDLDYVIIGCKNLLGIQDEDRNLL